jgi:hypothetical protein
VELHHLRPATIYFDVEPGGPILVLGGGLVGADLNKFAGALALVSNNHSGRFVVDLCDLDEWSLVAQAMLLMTARRKSDHGDELVLRGASEALREHSQQLGVFERMRSIDSDVDTTPWGIGGAAGGSGAHAVPLAGGDR